MYSSNFHSTIFAADTFGNCWYILFSSATYNAKKLLIVIKYHVLRFQKYVDSGQISCSKIPKIY